MMHDHAHGPQIWLFAAGHIMHGVMRFVYISEMAFKIRLPNPENDAFSWWPCVFGRPDDSEFGCIWESAVTPNDAYVIG